MSRPVRKQQPWAVVGLLACLFLLGFSGSAQAGPLTVVDDFNRPDGTNLGPNWNEANPDFRIENGTARSEAVFGGSLMTYTGPVSNPNVVGADVFYQGGPRVVYNALVLGYANLANNVFVKVQDNNANGDFDTVFFYYGDNGGGWPGMTGGPASQAVPTPFTSARLTLTLAGNAVTLTIDTNFDNVPELTYTRGGIPLANLGSGVGLGGFNNATFDNFALEGTQAIPEPASLALWGVGTLALAGLGWRRSRKPS